jgi:hypothetical protein
VFFVDVSLWLIGAAPSMQALLCQAMAYVVLVSKNASQHPAQACPTSAGWKPTHSGGRRQLQGRPR